MNTQIKIFAPMTFRWMYSDAGLAFAFGFFGTMSGFLYVMTT